MDRFIIYTRALPAQTHSLAVPQLHRVFFLTIMADLHYFSIIILLLAIVFPFLRVLIRNLSNSTSSSSSMVPTSYPIVGSILLIWKNKERRVQWIADIINSTPNMTFTLHRPFGYRQIFTGNPDNVQHILKSNFHNYHKGDVYRRTLRDFLGDGIFNADGSYWKFQRQVSSHQFNTRSLQKFVEHVVNSELSDRLIPVLRNAAGTNSPLDLQDVLQRFTFDNICKIAFGYDPAYLLPSLPEAKFATVFDQSLKLISERFNSNFPLAWKIKRALSIGKERQLKIKVQHIREFAKEIIRKKNQDLKLIDSTAEPEDLLSRFLQSGHSDEDLITDVVISFIIAGRDTSSAALTWFFWLIHNQPQIEKKIIKEINQKSKEATYDDVKDMVYTHASLCEAMRLYPPVPVSTKFAVNDDVLPDGTAVKGGTRIGYHPYAMGRSEKLWGKDCAEFRPERWLLEEEEKWRLVGVDPYSYPVFQAGPRVCLGKELAFLQMKKMVASVLRQFKVIAAEGGDPVYVSDFTSKMKGGFWVRIEERMDT